MSATETLQAALKEIEAEIKELESEYSVATSNRNDWSVKANRADSELKRLKEVREAIKKTGVVA